MPPADVAKSKGMLESVLTMQYEAAITRHTFPSQPVVPFKVNTPLSTVNMLIKRLP